MIRIVVITLILVFRPNENQRLSLRKCRDSRYFSNIESLMFKSSTECLSQFLPLLFEPLEYSRPVDMQVELVIRWVADEFECRTCHDFNLFILICIVQTNVSQVSSTSVHQFAGEAVRDADLFTFF